jgi:branched-chain amino acid transport system substrate-binding protein
MRLRSLGALAASAAFVFAACGTPGATGGTGAKGTIQIWSELPRQGSSKGQTDTIVNAIKLAIEERGGAVDGWTINYVDQDDSTAEAGAWTPERATALATEASTTADLVAYIGTFNSGAAKIVIPVLCKAGIAMISPANTYPGLTKPGKGEPGEPAVYYPDGCTHNYYRVVPADDLQGQVGADWAKELGATKVYVIDDSQVYGKGIADVFDAAAEAAGMEVLGHDQITGKETDYKSLAEKIKGMAPDLVYFGGITQQNAGQLWRDLRAAMGDVMLMGPDGIYEDAFLTAAGEAAEGTYLTFGGTTADQYTGAAAEFRDKYNAEYPSNPIQVYTIYGYEAATVVLNAIDTASKAGATDIAGLRTGTLKALSEVKDYPGVLGTWSFDANGDTSLLTFSGTQVEGGEFTFQKVLGGS